MWTEYLDVEHLLLYLILVGTLPILLPKQLQSKIPIEYPFKSLNYHRLNFNAEETASARYYVMIIGTLLGLSLTLWLKPKSERYYLTDDEWLTYCPCFLNVLFLFKSIEKLMNSHFDRQTYMVKTILLTNQLLTCFVAFYIFEMNHYYSFLKETEHVDHFSIDIFWRSLKFVILYTI
jgi:hypothetical protein